MSKSLGNAIGIMEPPSEIYGKTMSISDTLMLRYYELLTGVPLSEVKAAHPKEAKKRLARILVARFHSEQAAINAEREFESVFAQGSLPEDIQLVKLGEKQVLIGNLLVETKLAPSLSEARRLIKQGGVRVDDRVITEEKEMVDLTSEKVLNVGKRKFMRVICE
jgi:tyrosyl-tRNA synthetase